MRSKALMHRIINIITFNPIIKRTQWYKSKFIDWDHEIYPDNYWYRKFYERNYQIVALGSSSAKFAYNFEESAIKGMNWANQPQTLLEDFNLLRCYHSILDKNGIVLVTIMPFSGLNKTTGIYDALKYLALETQGEPIEPNCYYEACRLKNWPVLFGKPAIKALVKYLLGRESRNQNEDPAMADSNPMNYTQLEEDAQNWIEGWKRQFSISELEAPLTEENHKGRNFRIKLMRELIDFCIERGYRPVFVIPPVTKHLNQYFSRDFEKIYIYDFINQIDRSVELLDYSKNESLQSDDLYFNSFFLNRKGRKIFTSQLLSDLK